MHLTCPSAEHGAFLLPVQQRQRWERHASSNVIPKDRRQTKDTVIRLDLAKSVFQLHRAGLASHLNLRKRLTQVQLQHFRSVFAELFPQKIRKAKQHPDMMSVGERPFTSP